MSKRRFWQIHLSTAVVLMFVASVLLYVNTRAEIDRIEMNPSDHFNVAIGWPWISWRGIYFEGAAEVDGWFESRELLKNLCVGLALTILAGLICEAFLLRRESRP